MGKYKCYNENKGLDRCDAQCGFCTSLYGPRPFPGENRPKPWPLAKELYMDLHVPDLPRPLVSKLEQIDEAQQKDFKIQLADFIERYLTAKHL